MKDFTVEHAQDKVESYMGMMAEADQSFKGLIDHFMMPSQSGETLSELISNFYGWSQKARETEDTLPMICRCWSERLLHVSPL